MTSVTTRHSHDLKVHYNFCVLKRPCKSRAKWRLELGKPAAPLSEHYQLDCDFGTRVVAIYKGGDSNDPIYLCESHVAEVTPTAKNYSEIRLIDADPADSNPRKEAEESKARIQTLEVADVKPSAPSPLAAAPKPISKRTSRVATERPSRVTARDLTYGDSAKALVDEAIWNMATGDYEAFKAALQQGKSAAEAAEAAGGQLAIVHRKIGEYAGKIEAVLSASAARINVAEVIDKPFELAILEIIGNTSMSDAEKDAAIDRLGALQASINRGLDREITPLQAHQIACSIGERANWGANVALAEELKPAHRAVYVSVRNAIRSTVPHAQALDERLTNLYAAKSDLENAPAANAPRPSESVNIAT